MVLEVCCRPCSHQQFLLVFERSRREMKTFLQNWGRDAGASKFGPWNSEGLISKSWI